MPLTAQELKYFEALANERQAPIESRYRKELEQVDRSGSLNKHSDYTRVIKEYAREMIESRIDAYIDTFKYLNRYPGEADFQEFGEELKKIALNFSYLFKSRYRGFAGAFDQEWIERMIEMLRNQLLLIVGESIPRLRRFVVEGELKQASLPYDIKDDAIGIAMVMYERGHTSPKPISRTDLQAIVDLPFERFDAAEQYLLEGKYAAGTMGQSGVRWLLAAGVDLVKVQNVNSNNANLTRQGVDLPPSWFKEHTVAIISLIVTAVLAALAIVASVTVPEIRRFLGLE